jgi:hypothetical protein
MTEVEQARITEEEIFRKKVQAAIEAVAREQEGWRTRVWGFLNSEIVKGVLLSVVAIGLTAWIHSQEVERQDARQKADRDLQEARQAEERRRQETIAQAEKAQAQASRDIEREIRYVTGFIEYVREADAKLELSVGLLAHLVETNQVSKGVSALFYTIIAKYGSIPSPSPTEKAIVQQAFRAVDASERKETQLVKPADRQDIQPPDSSLSKPAVALPMSPEVCRSRRAGPSPARVYIQFTERGAEDAQKIRGVLDSACFVVPEAENITGKTAIPPKKTEIRLFRNSAEVLTEAARIKSIVEQEIDREVVLKYVNRPSVSSRLFEIWFGTED